MDKLIPNLNQIGRNYGITAKDLPKVNSPKSLDYDPNLPTVNEDLSIPNTIDMRSVSQQLKDISLGVGSSAVSTLGNIGGAVIGSDAYNLGNDISNTFNNLKTNYTKNLEQQLSQESDIANKVFDKQVEKAPTSLSALNTRIKQVVANIANTDIEQAASSTFGSALGLAPVIAATGGIGGLAGATGASVGASFGAGLGSLTDAGGQAYQQVINTPIEQLSQTSPLWNNVLEQSNGDPKLARQTLAEITAKDANINPTNVALSFGLGAATNNLAKGLAKGKIINSNLNTPLNVGIEAIGEGIDEGKTTYASNQAIQDNVDPSQSLSEGVTASITQGLVGSGITSTPSLVGNTIQSGLEIAKDVTQKPEDKEVSNIIKEVNKSSETVSSLVQPTENIPNNELIQAANSKLIAGKEDIFNFVSTEYPNVDLNKMYPNSDKETQLSTLAGVNNLMNVINNNDFKTNQEKIETARLFKTLVNDIRDGSIPLLAETTEADKIVNQEIKRQQQLLEQFTQTTKYQNSIKELETLTQEDNKEIEDIISTGSKEDIVLNQRKIKNVFNQTKTVFENNPLGISEKFIKYLYDNKEILSKNTDFTQEDLDFIDTLYNTKQDEQAAKSVNEEINSNVDNADELVKSNVDNVSYEISDIGKADGKKSLSQHIKGIVTALNSETKTARNQDGIDNTADELINNLGGFAGHMKRKAEAAIQSINGGKGEQIKFDPFSGFRQYNKDNERSKASVYVNLGSKNSIYTGLAVFNDAYSTINTYNNMVKEAQRQGLQLETDLIELPQVPEALLKNVSDSVRERFNNIAPVKTTVTEPTQENKQKDKKKTNTSFRSVKKNLKKVVENNPITDTTEPENNIPDSNVNDVKQIPTTKTEGITTKNDSDKTNDNKELFNTLTTKVGKVATNLVNDQVTKTDENITNDKVDNNVHSAGSIQESYYTDEEDLLKTYKTKEFKKITNRSNKDAPLTFKTFFPKIKEGILNVNFYTNLFTDPTRLIEIFNPIVPNNDFETIDSNIVIKRFNNFINKTANSLINNLTDIAKQSAIGKISVGSKNYSSEQALHLRFLLNSQDELDRDLVYKTSMAYVDWSLNLSNEKLITAELLGSKADDYTDYSGKDVHTLVQEVNTLLNLIKKYWGVEEDNNQSQTYTVGIAELLARYLITNSEEFGATLKYINTNESNDDVTQIYETYVLTTKTPYISDPNNKDNTPYNIYKKSYFNQTNFLKKITQNNDDIGYLINEPITDIDSRISGRNTNVTKFTQNAIKQLQNIKLKLNKPMYDLYRRIGQKNLSLLFSLQNKSFKPFDNLNKSFVKTLTGHELTTNENMKIAMSIGSQLDSLNDPEAGVYFKYNTTSVNRLQEAYGGQQSNKHSRQLLLTEEYSVNLKSDDKTDLNWYRAAIAQNLGLVKLEQIDNFRSIVSKLNDFKNKPEVKNFFNYLNDPKQKFDINLINDLKNLFDNEPEEKHIYGLTELNKYLNAIKNNDTFLSTMIVLEIDGIANGYNNAIGNYNTSFLDNKLQTLMQRGGLFYNNDFTTSNEFFNNVTGDTNDSYNNVQSLFIDELQNPNKIIKINDKFSKVSFIDLFPEIRSQVIPLLQSVKLTEENKDISLPRSEIKGSVIPITYGSGSLGTSKKMLKSFLDKVALDLSIQDNVITDQNNLIDTLTFMLSFSELNTNIKTNKDGKKLTTINFKRFNENQIQEIKTNISKRIKNSELFELTKKEFNSAAKVFQSIFGSEVHSITKQTLNSAGRNIDTIQQFTNLQSEVGKRVYEDLREQKLREINKSINELEDNTKNILQLSKNQEKEIFKQLQEDNILTELKHKNHVFDLGTSEKILSKNPLYGFDSFSSNSKSVGSYYTGVEALGVAFSATSNIGNGDGMMIQHFYNNPDIKDILPFITQTYDGIYVPVKYVTRVSEAINKAVWKTYQENLILPVAKQSYNFYTGTLKYLNSVDKDKQQELLSTIIEVSRIKNLQELSDIELVKNYLGNEVKQLVTLAAERQAFIDTVRDHVDVSINQMGGGRIPYIHKASKEKIIDENILREIQEQKFNEYYNKYVTDLKLEKQNKGLGEIKLTNIKSINENQSDIELFDKNLYNKLTQKRNTNGSILLKDIVPELLELKNVPKSLINKIIQLIDPNTVIYLRDIENPDLTSLDQIKDNLFPELKNKSIENGLFTKDLVTRQTHLFINNVSTETLVHELNHVIHVDMFSKYFGDSSLLTAEQVAYIDVLVTLKDEFLELESNDRIVNTVKQIISTDNDVVNMSEFVSWVLTNKQLKTKLENIKLDNSILNKIIIIVDKVFNALVKFFSNSKDKNQDNFYDTLLFTYLRALPKNKKDINPIQLLQVNTLNQKQINSFTEINTKISALVQKHQDRFKTVSEPNKTMFKDINNQRSSDNKLITNQLETVFNFSPVEKITFKNLMNLFDLGLVNKSYNINKLQQVYNKFINEVSYKDFIDSNTTENQARLKYENMTGFNENNLKVFFALSQTNSMVQDVLSRLIFKENKLTGIAISDKLNNLKIDILNSIDPVNVVGNGATLMNGITVDYLNSELEALDELERLNQTKYNIDGKITTAVVDLFNKVTDDKYKDVFKTNAISAAFDRASALIGKSDTKLPQALKDIFKELVGKTVTSENIENLMNIVKDKVQSVKNSYKTILPQNIKEEFKTNPDNKVFENLTTTVGKTDIFSLGSTRSFNEIFKILSSDKNVQEEISIIEKRLKNKDYIRKSKQLANYLITGSAGFNLLTNANSISILAGESNFLDVDPSDTVVQDIDHLVSLYAFQQTTDSNKQELRDLIKNDTSGLHILLSNLHELNQNENNKTLGSEINKYNRRKGYLPFSIRDGKKLIIATDTQKLKLLEDGFVRVGDYTDPVSKVKKGYYLSSVIGSPYLQGIMQTVNNSINGMNVYSGQDMTGQFADYITDTLSIDKIYDATKNNPNAAESYIPVIGLKGTIIAYQRNMRQNMLDLLNQEKDLTNLMGIMKSRQVEEQLTQEFNNKLIDRTFDLYKNDFDKSTYTNIATSIDPVIKDTWRVIPSETKTYIESVFGKDKFFVRNDLINNSLGYRLPSVSDLFTGKTKLSKETKDVIEKMMRLVLGSKAYIYLKNAEDGLQEYVKYTKEWIYLKSIVVPASNTASNILQLVMNGVPLTYIAKNGLKALSELKLYHKNELREIKINTILPSVDEPTKKKLQQELKVIEEVLNNLSIKPLVDAGEFSAVNEGVSEIDGLLSANNIGEFLNNQINKIVDTKKVNSKIPESLKTVSKYAIVAKDTALYKGLVQTVLYSDYVSKAIYYNHLVENQNMDMENAKRLVSEEFINYNFLPGRTRSYLESVGLLWFWNFKIRSLKVAGRMIVNNPFKSLLGSLFASELPAYGLGTPIQDNIVTNFSGVGVNNLLRPAAHNPLLNVIS